MAIEKVETLIIGGGQAGLAMSEHLSKRGVPHLIVDPGLYPPQSVFKRLVAQPPLSVNVEEEIGRIWGKLRSAQSTPDEPALSEITEKFPLKPKQENASP